MSQGIGVTSVAIRFSLALFRLAGKRSEITIRFSFETLYSLLGTCSVTITERYEIDNETIVKSTYKSLRIINI